MLYCYDTCRLKINLNLSRVSIEGVKTLCPLFKILVVSYLLTEKMYIQNLLLMSILHNPVIESFIFLYQNMLNYTVYINNSIIVLNLYLF